MNAQMNVLWESLCSHLATWPTMKKATKRVQNCWLSGAKWWKTLPKFEFSCRGRNHDILDKVIAADAELAKYVLSNEERSGYNKLYHPYEWADFKALVPELPLMPSLQKWSDKHQRNHRAGRAPFLEGIAPKYYFGSQLETIHAKLKLGAAFRLDIFLDRRNPCPVWWIWTDHHGDSRLSESRLLQKDL